MNETDTTVVRTDLGDGAEILVEARTPNPEQDVAVLDKLPWEGVEEAIVKISERVKAAIQSAAPKTASVEFGIDVSVESSGLTGLLAKGSGSANLKVTLTWGTA